MSQFFSCPKCQAKNVRGELRCINCGVNFAYNDNPMAETKASKELFPVIKPVLQSCPDCSRSVSSMAESCPGCGRFFQNLRKTNINRGGWIFTIATGVLGGYLMVIFLNVVVFLIIFIFFAGLLSSAAKSLPGK